ncbi:MAG: hypothetical protein EKE20_01855 [Candidatus Symbiopectobacterium sp. Dall1.0]|nr:hypothetical protein [Candidatus Symbiopectobacterium sp. Dall1.0]
MLKSIKSSAILFFVLLAAAYAINVFIYNKDSSTPHLSTLSLLIAIISLINSGVVSFIAVGVVFLFLLMLEIFYTLVFGERISVSVLSSIVESNQKEAFLMTLHYFFTLFLPAILITCFFTFFFKVKIKKIRLPIWFKLTPVFLYSMTAYSASSTLLNSFVYANVKEDNRELGTFLRDRYPAVIGDVFYIYGAIRSVDKYSITKQNMEFNESIDIDIDVGNPIENNLIVLIMGESSLFSRYSAYGHRLC